MISDISDSGINHLRLVHEPVSQLCAEYPVSSYIRSYDGRYISCENWLQTGAEIDKLAQTYLIRNVHQMAQWKNVDPNRLKTLTSMIDKWRSSGSEVFIVAPPYHPVTFQILRANSQTAQVLDFLDQNLRTIAEESKSHYFNLRDPRIVGCSSDEFEDSHHVRDSCATKLLDYIEKMGLGKHA